MALQQSVSFQLCSRSIVIRHNIHQVVVANRRALNPSYRANFIPRRTDREQDMTLSPILSLLLNLPYAWIMLFLFLEDDCEFGVSRIYLVCGVHRSTYSPTIISTSIIKTSVKSLFSVYLTTLTSSSIP
ncbi:hypothetical protein CC78DRAFT_348388 [Lojkania enalia]|uniref:Uncharacterized protein n=1 Tax=Lojkania enalia TaxID=147567 RepID=A0A9P4K562_9PLEO|nr:hypothetical protein CC78DRAFT_348388 [Didymosphaeria enalia]